ncbi:MAG: metallophosphoesterase family protein [Planctomycetaceae bacterium]
MRTLLLADIHSNFHALQAIDESYDRCIVLGDVVEYGTDPVRCVEWVRRHADYVIRGNHDHAVAQFIPSNTGGGFRRLAAATRPLHWEWLSDTQLRYLGRLPVTQYLDLEGLKTFLVHATPRDPLDEYLGADEATWRERLRGVEADLVLVGHTHQQFEIEVDGCRVVNPGSVGQPRDGDPRAAYAILEDGQITMKRVEYDVDASLDQMKSTDVDPWVIDLSAALWRSGGAMSKAELDQFV